MTDRKISIRPSLPEDAPIIAMIEKECFSEPWSESSIRALINDEKAVSVTAVYGDTNEIAGFGSYYFVLDEGYINNIAVRAPFRRRGVGAQIVESLKDKGKELGLSLISLEVRRSNEGAIALYSSRGFTETGVRKGFYPIHGGGREDAVLMSFIFEGPSAE